MDLNSAGPGPTSSEHVQAPPRRRLVKASTHALVHDSRKRDAAGVGSTSPSYAPPGFIGPDRSQSPTTMGTSTLSSPITAGGAFMDREKGTARSSNKDPTGEHQAALLHGSPKSGRPSHNSGPSGIEARPLGRRVEGSRRHEPSSQKHSEDVKLHQTKKAALLRAQQAGVTGSYKNIDSHFNNFLVPVIPMQFLSKSQPHSREMG